MTEADIERLREILLEALEGSNECEQNTKRPGESSRTPASAA